MVCQIKIIQQGKGTYNARINLIKNKVFLKLNLLKGKFYSFYFKHLKQSIHSQKRKNTQNTNPLQFKLIIYILLLFLFNYSQFLEKLFHCFTTWADCSKWNSKCVSDGTNCVPIGDCTSYTKQLSCENNVDTAGNACIYSGTCRLKQCSDKPGLLDSDCFSFKVKEGVCTTNGTNCVVRATCTSYTSKDSCTYGSDNIQCFYEIPNGQTQGTCRQILCTDFKDTTNDKCLANIYSKKCVTNGTNCIPQAACSTYKNKLSCQGGGTDGVCAFKAAPTATDPNAGTCTAFTSCDSASGDENVCSKNKACKYTKNTQKCEPTDCATMKVGEKCTPIPSFDGKTYTICTLANGTCTAGDPTTLAQADCYSSVSIYTYTWNESTAKCQSCKGGSQPNNNSSNGNQTDNNGSTSTDSGHILGVAAIFTLLGIFA